MKNLNLMALAMLAAAMTVGCSKDEVTDVSPSQVIGFKAMTDNVVDRAEVTKDNIARFRVYGCVSDKDTGANHTEIFGINPDGNLKTTVLRSGEAGNYTWTYENTQYWVSDKQYYFVALTTNATNPKWTFTAPATHSVVSPFKGFGTVSLDNSSTTGANCKNDLVYAYADKTTSKDADGKLVSPGVVNLTFYHLLSAIAVKVENTVENADYTFKVTSFEVGNLIAKGSVALGGKLQNLNWNETSTEKMSIDMDLAQDNIEKGKSVTSNKFFIIPGASQTLTVKFSVEVYLNGTSYTTHNLTGQISNQTFTPGNSYLFKTSLTADNINPDGSTKIEFDVINVAGWGTDNGDITLDKNK